MVGLATALILFAVVLSADPQQQETPVAFFLVADTHLLASKQDRDDPLYREFLLWRANRLNSKR